MSMMLNFKSNFMRGEWQVFCIGASVACVRRDQHTRLDGTSAPFASLRLCVSKKLRQKQSEPAPRNGFTCCPQVLTIRGAMKTFHSIIATLALTSLAHAAKEGWLDDLEKAKTQAKAENKKILLDFTGSDWCGWCKKLDAEVFSQQEFKDYAAKKLVLVELDFPKGFKLPEATKKQNDALAQKFKIRGYPTIVVTSASGLRKGELGYVEGGPKAFIKALEKAK